MNMGDDKMPPVSLLIKPVSGLCNMACKYCFYADVMDNRQTPYYGKMNEETLDMLVRKVFLYAEKSASFAFQGGEPTLAGIAFYEKLIELQEKYNVKGIRVFNSIQTNGYELDRAWANFFKKHNFLVGLSMDGYRELHDSLRVDRKNCGTYTKVERAAKLMADVGVDFNILTVVNNFVARYPRRVFEHLKKYQYLQFIPCIDSFDGEKEKYSLSIERYTKFLKETFDCYYENIMKDNYVSVRNFDNYIGILLGRRPENCAMNGRCAPYFLIEGDGSVYPCDFYVLDKWKIGNIVEDSFESLGSSEVMQNFISESCHIDEKCRECEWGFLCRGGCKRDREPIIDGIPGKNRYCECYQEFFKYAYSRMIKIADSLR